MLGRIIIYEYLDLGIPIVNICINQIIVYNTLNEVCFQHYYQGHNGKTKCWMFLAATVSKIHDLEVASSPKNNNGNCESTCIIIPLLIRRNNQNPSTRSEKQLNIPQSN